MDSILSSVLSIFSHNPIIVLGIIAYIAFSIIKSKNTEESDDYDNYESSSSGQTWEDMEREYGISIEKKPVEPSPEDLLYDDDFYREIFKNRPIENQHPEAPLRKKGGRLFQYDDTETSDKHVEVDPSNDKTQTARESVTGPSLNERLAEFKRDKASKEGRVLLENVSVTTVPAVTSTRKRKANHALKEGMKWSIILGKPKALERRYR
ncbi:MAG: hypothetical protein KH063_03240 [Veillonella sp.]|nr:hypothetical protein [Veillonella sp.]